MRKIVLICLCLNIFFTSTFSNTKIEITIINDNCPVEQSDKDTLQSREIKSFSDMVVLFLEFCLEKQVEKLAENFCEFISDYFSGKDFEARGKKEKETAAAIFGAVASACVQTGAILGSETEEEQQQGVLNLFATAFGLVSQLVKSQRSDLQEREKVVKLAVQLADKLYEKIKKDDRVKNAELMQQMQALQTQEDKISWVNQNLDSDVLVEKFLNEIFNYLKVFLDGKLEVFLNYIQHKLTSVVCGTRVEGIEGLIK